MEGVKVLFSCLCVLMACWGVFGSDCCSSYTDPSGTYHASQLCQDYCCWNLDLTNYKVCCSNPIRQVPSSDRDQQSCTESWITEHVWVPIVSGVVFLGLIVLCCCCCCGCCCFQRDRTVFVQSAGAPQTTVVVANQTNMMQNRY
ncbi:uncharacterized protein LOC128225601 [Mya arenaria]|uniref:uncharacterized protein LOC128225601 n=1 Tax=Mya arenaria TaxID=6604 RepID=UPI0022E59FE9|nr:uncharacterized protein LOC128225601 [Mya arenaria]